MAKYTAHAGRGKTPLLSSHKTYDNLNAAKHDARELARLLPNGKGLVVKHEQNPKSRKEARKNPSLGDYFRAGKKTALELAQQALKEAQEAADQAAKAAEAAKAERTVDSPEKALRVLAKKEGFELVRKNSGTSAMYKLGMRVATDTNPWERHNAWGGLSLKAAKEAIWEVSDGDECDYPTDKASVRDFLAGINAVLAKTPKGNRPNPNEKTVLGHTVRKTKTGYTIVPYNLHLPSMKSVTTYLKAHIAQEKK